MDWPLVLPPRVGMTLKPNTSGFPEDPSAAFSYSLIRSTGGVDLLNPLEPLGSKDGLGETGEDTPEDE